MAEGVFSATHALDLFSHLKIEVVGSVYAEGLPAEDDYRKVTEVGKELARRTWE